MEVERGYSRSSSKSCSSKMAFNWIVEIQVIILFSFLSFLLYEERMCMRRVLFVAIKQWSQACKCQYSSDAHPAHIKKGKLKNKYLFVKNIIIIFLFAVCRSASVKLERRSETWRDDDAFSRREFVQLSLSVCVIIRDSKQNRHGGVSMKHM